MLTQNISDITIESNQRVTQLTMENMCRVLEAST
jgi:hypothetical protein